MAGSAIGERLDSVLGELERHGSLRLRRAWPDGPSRLLVEFRDREGAIVAGRWDGRLTLAREDRRLPGLGALLARPGARLVGHRFGRRAVVALPDRFAKAVRPSRVERVVARARAAEGLADGFVVPRVRSVDPPTGVVELAPIRGGPLRAHDLGALRAALDRLHAKPAPPGLPEHDAAREAEVLRMWIARLEPWAPDLAAALGRAAELVVASLLDGAGPADAPVHGDLHDGQVLVDGDRIGMLDFDALSRGEPARDLGNLLAHLELAGISAPAWDEDPRVAAYAAATRLRLGCVHAFRPATRGLVWQLARTGGVAAASDAPTRRALRV